MQPLKYPRIIWTKIVIYSATNPKLTFIIYTHIWYSLRFGYHIHMEYTNCPLSKETPVQNRKVFCQKKGIKEDLLQRETYCGV